MSQEHWEHFSHEADVGVRGFGATKGEAFEQAARALTAVITDPAGVVPSSEVEIRCEAPDDGMLLVDWLAALVYEMATRGMVFSGFRVEIDGPRLRGSASGEALDVSRHRPAIEVKGITYTALEVTREPGGTWRAQCVVDV